MLLTASLYLLVRSIQDENFKKIQDQLGGENWRTSLVLKTLYRRSKLSVDIKTDDKTEEDKLKCKFYGDLILQMQPPTYQDSGNAVPRVAWSSKRKKCRPKGMAVSLRGIPDTKAMKMV